MTLVRQRRRCPRWLSIGQPLLPLLWRHPRATGEPESEDTGASTPEPEEVGEEVVPVEESREPGTEEPVESETVEDPENKVPEAEEVGEEVFAVEESRDPSTATTAVPATGGVTGSPNGGEGSLSVDDPEVGGELVAFSSIGVGRSGVCVTRISGMVFCWEGTGPAWTPSGVFVSVSVGHEACGIRSDGTVECWGSDADGTRPPEGRFATVEVNGYHKCGHLSNGGVKCWGSDPWLEPMPGAPEGMFISVSAGWAHACGIRPDNSVECWGNNTAG